MNNDILVPKEPKERNQNMNPNYSRMRIKRSIWNVASYWKIRCLTTLFVAILATVIGTFWSYKESSILELKSCITVVLFIVVFSIAWVFNKLLESGLLQSGATKKNWFRRFVRGGIYFTIYYIPSVISLLLLAVYEINWIFPSFTIPAFKAFYVMPQVVLLWGFVFAVDVGFLLYRWTYRVLPNVVLAIAAFIFYALLLSIPHGEQLGLRLGILDPERINFLLSEDFSKWLGWGILATVITTFVSKASEDLLHGFSRNGTGDYAKIDYRFKQQRRKLLSYRGEKGISLKNLDKMSFISIIYIAVMLIECVLIFVLKRDLMRRMLLISFLIGTICTMMGFMLHFFITDENLMRSENSYLIDRKIQAIISFKQMKRPCDKAGWEWSCFCQVFVNLFCSRNPIFYENNVLHDAGPIISYFLEIQKEDQKQKEDQRQKEEQEIDFCRARVIADFVYFHNEQFSLYCSTEAGPERDYMEVQFARVIASYVDFFGILSPGEPIDFSDDTMSIRVMNKCFDMYFHIEESVGKVHPNLFQVQNVSVNDMTNLIKLDCLRVLTNYRSENKCKLCEWCQKKDSGASVDFGRPFISEIKRKDFPQLVREVMTQRWGDGKMEPISWKGKQLTSDEAFALMEQNYEENWISEACRYNIDDFSIDDREYWRSGIFYEND